MKLWNSMMMITGTFALLLSLGSGEARAAGSDQVHFQLVPNPQFVNCLARYQGDPHRAPKADVHVKRGKLNDTMTLQLRNFKPGLAFDLFTVERSPLRADGTVDASVHGFGMAWYQSDIEVSSSGSASVEVRTILLDQIFGFDPDVALNPTNTFHVGFWFNDPSDAQNCSDKPIVATPFNGDHNAGPLAMISVPDADTKLGPLCTHPNTSTSPATCDP
jgi:hypothetical protein